MYHEVTTRIHKNNNFRQTKIGNPFCTAYSQLSISVKKFTVLLLRSLPRMRASVDETSGELDEAIDIGEVAYQPHGNPNGSRTFSVDAKPKIVKR